MLDFKQGLSVFKIDSFILDLIIKCNSICYKFIFQNKKSRIFTDPAKFTEIMTYSLCL